MIRTIIVEDEVDAQKLLMLILQEYCLNVEVVGIAADVNHGMQLITSLNPDLVFLDIQLGEQTGFQMLDQLPNKTFQLIITTAYQDSALEAFRYEAIDYVLKPYTPVNIIAAVERAAKRTKNDELYQKLDGLLNRKSISSKISLPTSEGFLLVNIEDVIRIEADRAYSQIYLTNGLKTMVSKPLKEMETLFPPPFFFRPHASHLINLQQLEKYNKEDGGVAVMSDQSQIPIARRRKNDFLVWIKSNGNSKDESKGT